MAGDILRGMRAPSPATLCLALLLAPLALRAQTATRAVVTVEGAPDGASTVVMVRGLSPSAQPAVLGEVQHVAGSARRASLLPTRDPLRPVALLVAQTRPSRRSTYNSSLFAVAAGGVRRLVDGLTDASRAMVTASGAVVVQRGEDRPEPEQHRALREATDALTLDVVDPRSGAVRTAWRGEGQIAFLAAAIGGDEVAVYHVSDAGSVLFALDVVTGAARVMARELFMARDFSYDASADAVVFARPSARGARLYEVASVPAHANGASPAVVWSAQSDHVMPRALRDGRVAVSLPGDRGLGVIARGALDATRVAPAGDGSDCALGESPDGRWVAVRHTTDSAESLYLWSPRGGPPLTLTGAGGWIDLAGFTASRSAR